MYLSVYRLQIIFITNETSFLRVKKFKLLQLLFSWVDHLL